MKKLFVYWVLFSTCLTTARAQIDISIDPYRPFWGFYAVQADAPIGKKGLEGSFSYIYARHYRNDFWGFNRSLLSTREEDDFLRRGHKLVGSVQCYPARNGERAGFFFGTFYRYALMRAPEVPPARFFHEHTIGFQTGRKFRATNGLVFSSSFGIGRLMVFSGSEKLTSRDDPAASMYFTLMVGFERRKD